MLKKFSVENFKSFEHKFTFDLSRPGNYTFSENCIRNGIVNKGAIYGTNGIGKSNLGLAIFDIVNNLTDKYKLPSKYYPFLNLKSKKTFASFEYLFEFDGHELLYSYTKKDVDALNQESLSIDGKEMLFYSFQDRAGYSNFPGSEALSLDDNSFNSRVKFIMNSAILKPDDLANVVLGQFKSFVNRMLLFYSLKENNFIGFDVNPSLCSQTIIEQGKLNDFERFLAVGNIHLKLIPLQTPRGQTIGVEFPNATVDYYDIASTGMTSMLLYYSWFCSLDQCSFVFFDEFDAFYHYELAEFIINQLKQFEKTQVFVTTHNTDLLSNDLMRPDSYFVLTDEKIDSLNHLTEKDLRLAHNLQKMFKARAFA